MFEGRWRLLETIRTYAFERLTNSGEAELAARKHAAFFCDLLAPTGDSPARLAIEDLPRYGREIDNVRECSIGPFLPLEIPRLVLSLPWPMYQCGYICHS